MSISLVIFVHIKQFNQDNMRLFFKGTHIAINLEIYRFIFTEKKIVTHLVDPHFVWENFKRLTWKANWIQSARNDI